MGRPSRGAFVSPPRFHIASAAPGALLELPDHAAHHAREVLRLRAGATVRVFDGRGAEFEGILDLVSRRSVHVRLAGQVPSRPESPLKIVLALAPLKGDRMETVIQKTTELGVSEIWPVATARTDAAARPALKGSRQERWEKVASGAAEQCGRAVVPRVAPTRTLGEMLACPFAGARIFLLEVGEPPPLPKERPAPSVLVLVGPAGGFEPSEVDRLVSEGFSAKGLGPRILRAETAAIAAVTALQLLWGDLA
jgi:16S rRNA (uracil1498-N3)-methyltransferase